MKSCVDVVLSLMMVCMPRIWKLLGITCATATRRMALGPQKGIPGCNVKVAYTMQLRSAHPRRHLKIMIYPAQIMLLQLAAYVLCDEVDGDSVDVLPVHSPTAHRLVQAAAYVRAYTSN